MSRLNFVVLIKHFSRAKGRLAPALSASGRAELANRLYLHNLRWLNTTYPQHNILVVTPDIRAAKAARDLGADFILEERCEGLNRAIAKGTEWSEQRGFDTQVLFFPDIARPEKADMDILLSYVAKTSGESLLALAVAGDSGTNVLLATPPAATPLVFGRNSSWRIVAAARERGLPCYPLSLRSLALDVDRPDDLRHCTESLPPVALEACV